MDRNYHTDDFERLLREKSDEFRMYPSKRIWHSIYNNIHPGRKWPSVAMTITLITALLLMGYLNTKNTGLYAGSSKNVSQQKTAALSAYSNPASLNDIGKAGNPDESRNTLLKDNTTVALNVPLAKSNMVVTPANNAETDLVNNTPGRSNALTAMGLVHLPAIVSGANTGLKNDNTIAAVVTKPTINEIINPFSLIKENNPLRSAAAERVETASSAVITAIPGDVLVTADQSVAFSYLQKTAMDLSSRNINMPVEAPAGRDGKTGIKIGNGNTAVQKADLIVTANKKTSFSAEEKEWIDNYALYNRPAAKKWANKLTWQLYATPSLVYRSLYDNAVMPNAPNTIPLANSSPNQDINLTVNQKPSIGFEIGTGLQYAIHKGVRIKAGIQLNFTRYNSEAFQNTHPFATRLTMRDKTSGILYEAYRTTPYSNKSGLEATKLHNQTFQIALPIGADIKLMGNEKIEWYAGATIQPTYVIGGTSYLISSDRRNYIKESAMLNKWNLNAGFETFISYKTGNGISWQIGPEFRSQLYSTNNKQIVVGEKLASYGLKIGITKTIK